MSVFRKHGRECYSYDFRWRGHRFSGTTGETNKRNAQDVEKRKKEEAKKSAIDRTKPLSFAAASTLYWNERGQFCRNPDDMQRDLAWLQKAIGNQTLLSNINDATVAGLVAKRRSEDVSNATVNRTVIDPLRAILTRAVKVWQQRLHPVSWKDHKLKQAQERIRELTGDEQEAYFANLRPDYHAIIAFAILSGCRRQEMIDMEWRRIDWRAKVILVTGKGDKTREIPLSDAIEAVLKPLPRAHAKVFTYASQRADNAPRGDLMPITKEGLKTTHRRTCDKAGIIDFRFHDLRHTAASRLLRATGNLKMVQKLLGHEDIKTTARYAHVTANDLLAAMNATNAGSLDVPLSKAGRNNG